MEPKKSAVAATRYDGAVARATGKPEEAPAPMVVSNEAKAMIKSMSPEDMLAFINEPGDFEYAPEVYTMEKGQRIDGILEGNGPDAELSRANTVTKQVETVLVPTWIIRDERSGRRLSILGSVQLDKKLPPFVGGAVTIVRGDEVETSNGFKTTNYNVRGPKLPNGQVRSFVKPREQKVIDAVAEEKPAVAGALPAAAPAPEDRAA